MKKSKSSILLPIIGGITLIAVGVIFLLENLGLIALDWEMLVGPIFGVGGLAFLLVFLLDREQWWALIPGCVLLGLGIIIFMSQAAIAESYAGAVFLGFIGLAFLLIYLFHRNHWWALIPGGVLLTLAGVTLVPEDLPLFGGIFFLGLALTFGLVYIAPKPEGKMPWALYPAGAMLLIGILATLDAANLIHYIWPLALLIGGGVVLYRAIRRS